MTAMATGELGHRALMYKDHLGLEQAQVEEIITHARQWRVRYIELAEEMVELAQSVDDQICKYQADLDEVTANIDLRLGVLRTLDTEFIETWAKINAILTPEQHAKLDAIYRREFQALPHPAFGSGSAGAALGGTREALPV